MENEMPGTTTTTYTVTWADGTTNVYVSKGTCVETSDSGGTVQWVFMPNATKDGEDPKNRNIHLGIAREWSKTVVTT